MPKRSKQPSSPKNIDKKVSVETGVKDTPKSPWVGMEEWGGASWFPPNKKS